MNKETAEIILIIWVAVGVIDFGAYLAAIRIKYGPLNVPLRKVPGLALCVLAWAILGPFLPIARAQRSPAEKKGEIKPYTVVWQHLRGRFDE